MRQLGEMGLDQALERTGDGAFIVSGDGRILSWNRAAQKILGFTAKEVVGRRCCDIFTGRDENDNRLCYQGCHVMTLVGMGEAVQSFDMRTRTKGGQAAWINVSILPLGNGSASGDSALHLFRDVTASKELLTLVHERLARAAGGDAPEGEALSRREVEVLRLLAAGVKTGEAAERLHVSRATIRNHVQHVLTKLGAHSRLEAVAIATRRRLL
jgi:PAS domain S-box-containing protein